MNRRSSRIALVCQPLEGGAADCVLGVVPQDEPVPGARFLGQLHALPRLSDQLVELPQGTAPQAGGRGGLVVERADLLVEPQPVG